VHTNAPTPTYIQILTHTVTCVHAHMRSHTYTPLVYFSARSLTPTNLIQNSPAPLPHTQPCTLLGGILLSTHAYTFHSPQPQSGLYAALLVWAAAHISTHQHTYLPSVSTSASSMPSCMPSTSTPCTRNSSQLRESCSSVACRHAVLWTCALWNCRDWVRVRV